MHLFEDTSFIRDASRALEEQHDTLQKQVVKRSTKEIQKLRAVVVVWELFCVFFGLRLRVVNQS